MSRRRHTPEQVVRKLREADRLLGEGIELPEVFKQLEVSEQTYYRWRNQFGGMKAEDVKRLEGAGGGEREAEADRRRSGPGEPGVEGDREGKLVSPSRRRRAVLMLQDRLGLSERRACRYVGQPRSTQRREPVVAEDDAALRARAAGVLARAAAVGVPPSASASARCRAGASIASGCSGCGARKGSACRRSAANASGAGNRRCRAIGCGRSVPITCGRSTSSST